MFIYKNTMPHFAHAASLLDLALKVPFFLKYQQLHIPNMKAFWATLAHADLEQNTSTGFWTRMSNMGFSDWRAGLHWNQLAWRMLLMYCVEHNNTTAKMRGEREKADKWEAHEAKTCRSRTSVTRCKMLKTVYKYSTLTVKHSSRAEFHLRTSQKLV